MPRKITDLCGDVLEHIANIEEFIAGKVMTSFEHDKLLRQSVYWSLFSIAEAVTEMLRQEPSLDLSISDHRGIKSVRNLLAHSYWAINPELVWDTCTVDLPKLKSEVLSICDGH